MFYCYAVFSHCMQLHQKELELREKQVQEKLEHEFQLQQVSLNPPFFLLPTCRGSTGC